MAANTAIAQLNVRLKAVAAHDWCHRVELDASSNFVPADNLRYRLGVIRDVFMSLCPGKSVLVLNEISRIYPTLLVQSGASAVTANHAGRANVELMTDLQSLTKSPFEVVPQALLTFHEGRVLVDLARAEHYHFVFAQNLIWGLFNAAGQRFDDIVEGLAHYVSDGVIIDWIDARWAEPLPPAEYTRANLHAALRERCEYVVACNDWLTLALGKLPAQDVSAAKEPA
jgi:hypothetical protein